MSEIHVLKSGSCPSLSGRSELLYHIGCKEDRTIHLSLAGNTGRGLFSNEWLPLPLIEKILMSDEFSTDSFHSLFKGKSVNSAGFLMAVLKHEGLVKTTSEKLRRYERIDPTEFNIAIQTLMDSGVPSKKIAKGKNKKTPMESLCSPSPAP